jgi:uncharacterized protein YndB with AHSA1/START domain
MSEPTVSVVHASFSIERVIDAPQEKVFAAFADTAAKERWFKGPNAEPGSHVMDFREGGHESNSGKFQNDITHRFEATYYDIVPNERIVYAYEMYLNDKRISVSLSTIVLQSDGDKTKLMLTENGAFLDGADTPEMRERGSNDLLNALVASL